MRVIRHVRVDEYGTLYAPALGRAVSEPPEKKLQALLGEGRKLPGIGASHWFNDPPFRPSQLHADH
jgi:hypothetical protein